ncbi:MAG: MoaD/ThiS family protein [Planctomycetes bacterium]|nr:MoaD/ThiS family protein [Planctomycetota bacterium]
MKLSVKLFALAKDLVGREVVEIELDSPATVDALRRKLAAEYHSLASLVEQATFAINAEYATGATKIPEDAEVACIPPVSGG